MFFFGNSSPSIHEILVSLCSICRGNPFESIYLTLHFDAMNHFMQFVEPPVDCNCICFHLHFTKHEATVCTFSIIFVYALRTTCASWCLNSKSQLLAEQAKNITAESDANTSRVTFDGFISVVRNYADGTGCGRD